MPQARADLVAGERVSAVFLSPGKRGEVFWELVAENMQAAARQLNIEIEVIYSGRNHRLMRSLGLEIIGRAKAPDFLLLTNEDNAGVPLLEAADAAGIRTLLISSDVSPADWERLGGPREVLKTWIGSLIPDMEAAGARMGRSLLAEARQRDLRSKDGKLHLLELGANARTRSSVDRQRGFERLVAAEADVVVDRKLFANFNAADAEELTRKYLIWARRSGIRVAGVWAANDPMAIGAMKALRAAGLSPGHDVMVVGLNWSREAIEHVKAGSMVLTDGGQIMLGTWSMIMLRDYLDGCDPFVAGASKSLPTAAVTRENAARILPLLEKGQFTRVDVGVLRSKTNGACRPYDFSMEALLWALGASEAR